MAGPGSPGRESCITNTTGWLWHRRRPWGWAWRSGRLASARPVVGDGGRPGDRWGCPCSRPATPGGRRPEWSTLARGRRGRPRLVPPTTGWWRPRRSCTRRIGGAAGWSSRSASARRAAGEWGGTPERGRPLALVEFYRSRGAPLRRRSGVAGRRRATDPAQSGLAGSDPRRYNVLVDRPGVLLAALDRSRETPDDGDPKTAPVTLPDFARWKQQGRKISVLTAYDFTTARLLDAAGVDCLLVGDTLGMVVQGRETTLRRDARPDGLSCRDGRPGRAAGRWSWPTCRS